MSVCNLKFVAFMLAICVAGPMMASASAQDFVVDSVDEAEPIVLERGPAKSTQRYVAPVIPTKPSAKELRQARALHRSQQREARLQHNLWNGYEPLRPNWNAIPMMASPYSYKRTIYVPVYIRR